MKTPWSKEKVKEAETYKFMNDKIKLLEESRRDSEKVLLNSDVNIRQLNRLLTNPNKQGTAEIAQGLTHYEQQKKHLIDGIKVINDMILEIYEEDNKAGKKTKSTD